MSPGEVSLASQKHLLPKPKVNYCPASYISPLDGSIYYSHLLLPSSVSERSMTSINGAERRRHAMALIYVIEYGLLGVGVKSIDLYNDFAWLKHGKVDVKYFKTLPSSTTPIPMEILKYLKNWGHEPRGRFIAQPETSPKAESKLLPSFPTSPLDGSIYYSHLLLPSSVTERSMTSISSAERKRHAMALIYVIEYGLWR
ncbi:hypothetical protein CDAR_280661 [Caerostris darwini]|uniref:Uncharacterized protein n=1 Tax=Caerostris darwini TaxID=1538125 RepID=A0AAV4MEQ7_9ARAC|nr:hypothetical protein CDAR_280661 [Caerostris darwini]